MQDRPVCFHCVKPIETNAEMVFEALCGCDEHVSAVFHAICLFEWRDRREEITRRIKQHIAEHHGGEHGEDE